MEFRILGPVEVLADDRALDLGRPKQRALLGLLLLRAGQAVSADRLVDELWNGRPPGQALASLQSYISNLRRALEPGRPAGEPPQVLVRRPAGYVVQVDPSELDASRFEAGVARARRDAEAGENEAALRHLDEALALWRDEPLAGLADDVEPIPEIARLSELRLEAVEERADAALALGRHAELVADLDAFVREHPLRERPRGELALALYRVGRQADALERLREGRVLLSEELGLDPSPALRELEQQILQHAPELQWTRPAAPAVHRPERAIVGREEELAPLLATWEAAVEGHGAVALISGEPGIGKTRLAEELASLVAADGGVAYWGRAFEAGGAPAFWPWAQVLEAAVADLDDEALGRALGARAPEVARIVPEVSERLGAAEEPVGDAGEARFRLNDAVARFLLRLAAARPLLVVLDDVHWADASSLELLRWVAGRLRAAPLLLVATYRDSESDRGPALTDTLAGLVREAPLVRVELEGLTVEDVSLLMAQQLAARPPDELARALHAQTDGNAFYVSELVRLVQASDSQTPSWDEVPSSVREVIERRVAGLPGEAVAALEAGAVIGRDFELETAAAAQGVAPDALLELLDPAVAARIVVPADGSASRFRFAHALVRETIYGGLPNSRRVKLHAAVGRAIERLFPGARLSELAFHFERAAPLGYADSAVDAAVAASERAAEMLAFEQAEAHLRQALRVLEHTGDPGRRECGVQARLTSLLLMTSGYSSPRLAEAAARVRELAAHGGDDPELASVLWALWSYRCVRAEFAEALEIAHELTAHGRALGDPAGVAAGLQARGTSLVYSGRLLEGIASFEAALEELGPIEAPPAGRFDQAMVGIHTLAHSGHALTLAGRWEEADARLREALRWADRDRRPFEYATVALCLGFLAALRDDLAAALEWFQEAVQVSEDMGFQQLGAMGGAILGWVQALTGGPDAGIATIEAAIATMDATGGRLTRHRHFAMLAEALAAVGREDEALAALDRGLDAWRETGEAIHLPEVFRLKGELLLRRGEVKEGLGLLEEAVAVAERQGALALLRRAEDTLESARSPA